MKKTKKQSQRYRNLSEDNIESIIDVIYILFGVDLKANGNFDIAYKHFSQIMKTRYKTTYGTK